MRRDEKPLTHPCLTCGACCAKYRVLFHWSERLDDSLRVPSDLTVRISPHLDAMKGTELPDPRCVALKGTIGESVACTIYDRRPSSCRVFAASFENGVREDRCDAARVSKGLPPLSQDDWSFPQSGCSSSPG